MCGGGGSQSLGSVPSVAAARTLSAPADTAPAAGRVDEGQARALAIHRLGSDTSHFSPLSPGGEYEGKEIAPLLVWQEGTCELEGGTPVRRKAWNPA